MIINLYIRLLKAIAYIEFLFVHLILDYITIFYVLVLSVSYIKVQQESYFMDLISI